MNVRIPVVLLLLSAWSAAQLPITRVILYKSGVGAIERDGTVAPGVPTRLTFSTEEMNDVLKSLTVADESGGQVSDVRFRADEPPARQFSVFPFHLTHGTPLFALLDQLLGARVTVQQDSRSWTGTIVGAHSVAPVKESRDGAVRQELTLLLDSGDLRSFDLDQLQGVRLLDPALQAQLRDYLARLASSRSDHERDLNVELTGRAPQKLRIRYIQAAPVWKSTWRLMLRGEQPPLLEGWAIVNNTSGDDWRNVHMELVSGHPVSFISPLYRPAYVQRAEMQLPEDEALTPVAGLQTQESEAPPAMRGVIGNVLGGVTGGIPSAVPPPPAPQYKWTNRLPGEIAAKFGYSSVKPQVALHPRGGLFTYALTHPVTIDRGQAAMVPILQQPVTAERVIFYSPRTGPHPRIGLRLTNSTGATLDGGPILIYDGNAYAGEGMISAMPGGDERMIDYASSQEITVHVETRIDSLPIQELHASGGILYCSEPQNRKGVYHIDNAADHDAVLTLERPVSSDFKRISPQAARQTPGNEEFRVPLKPHSVQDFTVNERIPYIQRIALAEVSTDTIEKYLHEKSLTDKGRSQLEGVFRLMQNRDQVNAESASVSDAINELSTTQDRLRKNIDSLRPIAAEQAQVKTYADELAKQESQFDQLQQKRDRLHQQADELSGEIVTAVQKLDF